MPDLAPLIGKLQAWSMEAGSFHGDRQLADEVLIADGWRCEPDDSFEGGIRWFVGTWPEVSTSESSRPHVVNDLNTAIGVVPRGFDWGLTVIDEKATAIVWRHGYTEESVVGQSERPSVAILIAALKAKDKFGV